MQQPHSPKPSRDLTENLPENSIIGLALHLKAAQEPHKLKNENLIQTARLCPYMSVRCLHS